MRKLLAISLAVLLALGLVIVVFPAQPAMAQSTIYVNDDAPNDPGPGDPIVSDPLEDGSATHPFDEIQEGIDAALYGDTVSVAAGIYYENITLKDGVQVLGAGADVTTIDGGGAGSVVTAIGVGSETVLDGFTITNGSATDGGGMYNSESSPMVTNCTFYNNSASNGGGGMYNDNSSPTAENCTFSTNSATWAGGGMYNDNSSPSVTNCTFSGNSAYDGGGMANDNSSPTVSNCTFASNWASGGGGGGIYDDVSSPTVTNCTFSGNSAHMGGGMHNRSNCSPKVTNCVFYNNSAGRWGGGMAHSHGGSPIVINSTFYNNSATSSGDGLYNYELSSLTVTNCILWGNGEEIFWSGPAGTSPTVTYSDVQGGYSGVGNIDANPQFVDPTGGNYHLQAGSPCIDAGTNEGAPTEDIEGNPRPIDGDGDGTAITDMGAYEYVPPPVMVPTMTQWGAIAMAAILGLLVFALQRRPTSSP